jgi:cold shock CspA family protein
LHFHSNPNPFPKLLSMSQQQHALTRSQSQNQSRATSPILDPAAHVSEPVQTVNALQEQNAQLLEMLRNQDHEFRKILAQKEHNVQILLNRMDAHPQPQQPQASAEVHMPQQQPAVVAADALAVFAQRQALNSRAELLNMSSPVKPSTVGVNISPEQTSKFLEKFVNTGLMGNLQFAKFREMSMTSKHHLHQLPKSMDKLNFPEILNIPLVPETTEYYSLFETSKLEFKQHLFGILCKAATGYVRHLTLQVQQQVNTFFLELVHCYKAALRVDQANPLKVECACDIQGRYTITVPDKVKNILQQESPDIQYLLDELIFEFNTQLVRHIHTYVSSDKKKNEDENKNAEIKENEAYDIPALVKQKLDQIQADQEKAPTHHKSPSPKTKSNHPKSKHQRKKPNVPITEPDPPQENPWVVVATKNKRYAKQTQPKPANPVNTDTKATSTTYKGKIKRWNHERGYGFIDYTDENKQYNSIFCHVSDLPSELTETELPETPVEFTIYSKKDKHNLNQNYAKVKRRRDKPNKK